jgi:hypothetical protein
MFIVTIYVVLKLAQWVLSLPTIDGPDSHSYLPGPGLAVPPNWYVGFEKVSFTGEGVIRPWTVALPYALLLTDYFRSLFQLAVSVLAFLLLAYAMIRTCRDIWLGRILALVVLTFSCTTLVSSWDMLMNRESLAISLTVALVGLAFLSSRYRSIGFLFLVILNSLLLIMTRPTLAPLAALILAALLVTRARRTVVSVSSLREIRAGTVIRGALAASFAALTFAYPAAYSVRMDSSWAGWYEQTMSETQFGYVVSDYNPKAESLKAALALDAPACLIEQIPVDTGDYVGAPWGFAAKVRDSCPEFADWFTSSWPSWYYRYIVKHPDYVAKIGISGLPIAMRPWDATKSFSPLPSPLRDALFPVTTSDGTSVYDPVVFYWGVALGIVLLGLYAFRQRSWQFVRVHGREVALVGAIVIGGLISILTNLLLIPSYPLETNRVNVSAALALRMTGTLVALFLCWRVVAMISDDRANRRAQAPSRGRHRTTSRDS